VDFLSDAGDGSIGHRSNGLARGHGVTSGDLQFQPQGPALKGLNVDGIARFVGSEDHTEKTIVKADREGLLPYNFAPSVRVDEAEGDLQVGLYWHPFGVQQASLVGELHGRCLGNTEQPIKCDGHHGESLLNGPGWSV
jgi:hypothetical protein